MFLLDLKIIVFLLFFDNQNLKHPLFILYLSLRVPFLSTKKLPHILYMIFHRLLDLSYFIKGPNLWGRDILDNLHYLFLQFQYNFSKSKILKIHLMIIYQFKHLLLNLVTIILLYNFKQFSKFSHLNFTLIYLLLLTLTYF